jgi:endonuclease YncB( thermonuclease family)
MPHSPRHDQKARRMKSSVLLAVCAVSILLACSRTPSERNLISGTVVAISDGDTVTIIDDHRTQHKIRLKGIDAPDRRQPFNQVSKQHLSQLIFRKHVAVIFDSENKYDRWGRIIGKITVDGNDVNLQQIRAGLAWHYKKYETQQPLDERVAYANAEIEARTQRRELWQEPNPTPPWLFRHHTTGSYEDRETSGNEPSTGPTPLAFSQKQPQGQPATSTSQSAEEIRGNKQTKIYHWPGCPNYDDIALHNRVRFKTREEAERAGYRAARNCP